MIRKKKKKEDCDLKISHPIQPGQEFIVNKDHGGIFKKGTIHSCREESTIEVQNSDGTRYNTNVTTDSSRDYFNKFFTRIK